MFGHLLISRSRYTVLLILRHGSKETVLALCSPQPCSTLPRCPRDRVGLSVRAICPRRHGKTEFWIRDMMPAAITRGYVVAYVNLWDNKEHPAGALIQAMRAPAGKQTLVRRLSRGATDKLKKVKVGGKISAVGEASAAAARVNTTRGGEAATAAPIDRRSAHLGRAKQRRVGGFATRGTGRPQRSDQSDLYQLL
jgi:hypothetical protein